MSKASQVWRREEAHEKLPSRVGAVERKQSFSAGSHSVLGSIAGAIAGGLFGFLGGHV
jgi:outer membrane lipoprotein SlyB